MFDAYDNITARLRASGDYLWPLVLRLIMFWEFWEAGTGKLRGENWFTDIPVSYTHLTLPTIYSV